jgi:hypothetical protein
MTRPNPFLWPAGTSLRFYNGRGQLRSSYINRRLDLADTLMLHWPLPSRTVYFALCRKNVDAGQWTEAEVLRMEERIRYDLNFDCYQVTINRLCPVDALPLTDEFRWKLRIRSRWIERTCKPQDSI